MVCRVCVCVYINIVTRAHIVLILYIYSTYIIYIYSTYIIYICIYIILLQRACCAETMPELVYMSHDSAVINRCWYIAMVDHVLTDLYLSKRCANNNSINVAGNY